MATKKIYKLVANKMIPSVEIRKKDFDAIVKKCNSEKCKFEIETIRDSKVYNISDANGSFVCKLAVIEEEF